MTSSDKSEIKNIISIMQKADSAYWDSDKRPIISDSVYDSLYFKLKQYRNKYPRDSKIKNYLNIVHHDTNNTFRHVKQGSFIGSLDKTRTVPEVSRFLNKWSRDPKKLFYTKNFLIQEKLDGLSVVLYFNDKRMPHRFEALTRGGGYIGSEINNTLFHFNRMNMGQIIKDVGNRHLIVRGEALIGDRDFRRVNKMHHHQWANSRNLASGTLMTKNPKIARLRGLFMGAYTLINRDEYINKYPTELSQLRFLRSLGFNIIKDIHVFPNSKEGKKEILRFMFHFSTSERSAIGWPIDGMVIKPNYSVNNSKIGWNKHGANYSKSFKFAPKSAIGLLSKIRWQISANGRLTPVGILKHPIDLLGSKISKASLGTIGNMKKYHICLNSYVIVRRMNDVIPKFFNAGAKINENRVLTPPSETLPRGARQKGKYYYLPSSADSATVLVRRWSKFVSKPCLNVMGLSGKVIRRMIQHRLIDPHSFASLFRISRQAWLQLRSFGAKGWSNLRVQLRKAAKAPLAHVLLGLPIPNAGMNALAPISREIGSYRRLCRNPKAQQTTERKLLHDIPRIKGLGDATKPIIKALFSKPILHQLDQLCQYMRLEDNQPAAKRNSNRLNGAHFVITGKLSQPRKRFTAMIKQNGGKTQSSVNGKTDYLVCNHRSNSTKYRTAIEKHVKIINERQFKNLLANS